MNVAAVACAGAAIAAVAASSAAATAGVVTLDQRVSCPAKTGAGVPTLHVYFDPGYQNTPDATIEGNGTMPLARITLDPRMPLSFNRAQCRTTKTAVPLTPKGLAQGPGFETFANCITSARVLVRLHVVRRSASGPVVGAYLSMRTQRGKPIAYVAFTAKKRVLYFSNGCSTG